MKDEVKEMAVDIAAVEAYAIKGTGLSAPFWVQYLETVINPVVAFLIALVTFLYIGVKTLNGIYEWRANWKKRLDGEREYAKKHRRTDDA